MIKVLMVGNDPSVRGGITSVIGQLLDHNWTMEDISMNFIPTYIEGSSFKQGSYFLSSYKKISSFIKHQSPDVVHIHMSYKGSFFRAYLIYKL